MAYDWPGGFQLQFFGPGEFDRPELMDPTFLQDLDRIRMRCGFPLTITDDARNDEDLHRIYAQEIAKGQDYPRDSAHLYVEPTLVRAVDIKPSVPRRGDGSDLTLGERELELTHQIGAMRKEGKWLYLGLGIETGHWHVDDTPRLEHKRPEFWVAVSR